MAFVDEPTGVVYRIYIGRRGHFKKEVKACGLIVVSRYLFVICVAESHDIYKSVL